MARLIQVIETEEKRGDGREDPIRMAKQWWTPEGELLCSKDPIRSEQVAGILRSIPEFCLDDKTGAVRLVVSVGYQQVSIFLKDEEVAGLRKMGIGERKKLGREG